MSNKVKYNLKNVHAAKLTTEVVEGVTTYTYATPKAIPGAVSLSLDAEGDSSPFYADGIVYFRTYANNGYSGDLEIALIPEWFRTEILKETLDTNGVLIEKAENTENVKFALLFEFDGDEHAIRHVMYNCSASRPSIKSQTKESTIEPVTETLSLTADPREDGLVKGRTGDITDQETYDGWYESVYVPLDTLSLEHTTLPTGIDLTGGGQNDA
jgi:phi13 family phage major tail protein